MLVEPFILFKSFLGRKPNVWIQNESLLSYLNLKINILVRICFGINETHIQKFFDEIVEISSVICLNILRGSLKKSLNPLEIRYSGRFVEHLVWIRPRLNGHHWTTQLYVQLWKVQIFILPASEHEPLSTLIGRGSNKSITMSL